jgi:hypothetical protein
MVLGEPRTPVAGGDANVMSLLLLGLLATGLLLLGIYIPHALQQGIQNAVSILEG